MKLTVAKNTFEKNLLVLELSISFSDYDGFVTAVREKVMSDVLNTEISLTDIFGYDTPSLNAIRNNRCITDIKDSYLISLLNSGCFSRFYTNSEKDTSKKVQINSYKLKLLQSINSNLLFQGDLFHLLLAFIDKETSFLNLIKSGNGRFRNTSFNTTNISFIKADALTLEDLTLSIEEKEQIKFEIYELMCDFQNCINTAPIASTGDITGIKYHFKYHPTNNYWGQERITEFQEKNITELTQFDF